MDPSRQDLVDGIVHQHLAQGDEVILTASEVARCVSSPFALYCDWFAPESERDEDSELLRIRREHGIAHELEMIEGEVIPIPSFDTLEENFRLTVEMMADGVPGMYNMLLMSNPVGMMGAPDQLLRVDNSRSVFGDYSYRIAEVKSNLNLTPSHKIQAAFYNQLLGLIQGSTPQTFTMIDGRGSESVEDVSNWERYLSIYLERTRAVALGEMPEPVYRQTPAPWRSYGDKIAQEDLTCLYQIGYTRRQALIQAGYYAITDVANASALGLSTILRIDSSLAECVIAHAKSLSGNKPIIIRPVRLPSVKTEIYLDMEHMNEGVFQLPDSWNGFLNYLIGIVIRTDSEERYTPFFASTPDEEEECWREFCNLLESVEDPIIYYWSKSAEKVYARKLLDRYGAKPSMGRMFASSVDIFSEFTNTVALPAESYGLKDVAKYLGYEWHSPQYDGMWAMLRYTEYLDSRDIDIRKEILTYNEDDCRAVMHVKDWLVENSP